MIQQNFNIFGILIIGHKSLKISNKKVTFETKVERALVIRAHLRKTASDRPNGHFIFEPIRRVFDVLTDGA